ncbi:MAG: L-rhamnose mutarotase [Proteobacteria bacterium]|jgi:L-rhamnose mutarotase|nr:L-rhamnose mutarotase [Pseudomonadota bacterium]
MKKFILALDLKNNSDLISEYIRYHKEVWPEIIKSIRDSGILGMEIFHVENRLFMIITADGRFSFENKQKMDSSNEKVQEWEELMWKFQQALPGSKSGEKWRLMEKIFDLDQF